MPSTIAVPNDLVSAISSKSPVIGHTHNFYRYPARFSPLFVREAIRHYSQPGDVILDPFMGGGTSIVEAIASGRKAIGIDLNTLAHFVATVKTSPLSDTDVVVIRNWLSSVLEAQHWGTKAISEPVKNLPEHLQQVWGELRESADLLPAERQRAFVRCALLKSGQSAIDCTKSLPPVFDTIKVFCEITQAMLNEMAEFVASCRAQGVPKNKIRQNRLLLCRSAVGIEDVSQFKDLPKPVLVVTSPPYPAVHILYHRWQVEGRRETPAPYWLAALKDGHGASHYTFGSRSVLGLENYFRNVRDCFSSVRKVISPNGIVIQLVAFSNTEKQLPRYLESMEIAGFVECDARAISNNNRLWRSVPNRKWYCHTGDNKRQDSAKEVVLFHRPI